MEGSIKRETILYVDDEEINLFLFQKRFERTLDVLTAESGEEALRKLKQNGSKIKAVITDMRMPGMTGLEFVGEAKKEFNEISYYILTGYEASPELEDAISKKLIKNLFKKPFDFEQILNAISE
ncbi:MAG: response regulator [Bacteroidota bacterium]